MCILCVTYGQSLMGSLVKPQCFCIIHTLLASKLNGQRFTLYKPWLSVGVLQVCYLKPSSLA